MIVVLLSSCSSQKTQKVEDNSENANIQMALPPVVIYKTTKDYYYNVPVTMNEAKTKIVSYPAKSDVAPGGTPAYPIKLEDGFLLDKRGVRKNSVFLDYTYEEYMKLPKTPSAEELLNHVLDKYPFEKIYNCGTKPDYKNLIPDLNKLILERKFDKFKEL